MCAGGLAWKAPRRGLQCSSGCKAGAAAVTGARSWAGRGGVCGATAGGFEAPAARRKGRQRPGQQWTRGLEVRHVQPGQAHAAVGRGEASLRIASRAAFVSHSGSLRLTIFVTHANIFPSSVVSLSSSCSSLSAAGVVRTIPPRTTVLSPDGSLSKVTVEEMAALSRSWVGCCDLSESASELCMPSGRNSVLVRL